MERNSSGNLECIDQFLKNLKVRSPHVNKSSTESPLAQSSKGAPHTLNHTVPSPLLPQTGLRGPQS